MTNLNDAEVQKLLSGPNYAVVSTLNPDGTVLSNIVWVSAENGSVALNSALGRRWPSNLQRDPRITVLVYDAANPYNYVEIRGTAVATTTGADDHINALAKKYIGQDEYPYRQPGEERVKFVVEPDHVRHTQM